MNIDIKNMIEKYKLIAIIRRIYGEDLIRLVQALYAGGIRLLEITFDQAEADCITRTANAIQLLFKEMDGKLILGAGTVLTTAQVQAAADSGARYIVSPNTDQEVIGYTREKGLVSIPGAMTPSEMVNAVKFGADYVKVFPYSDLGPKYMKSITAPLNHIKFIATGGVNLDNMAELLEIGFTGAGIGGFLSDKKLIKNGEFSELTRRAQKFVEIVNTFSKK